MTERRYGDEEVREILSLATTGEARAQSHPADPNGLTLSELQRIGQEAGIEPVRIAQAAAQMNARVAAPPIKRSFGLPIGMTRVIEIPRAPTDREWEQLISDFRTTFGSMGESTTSGGLRQWTDGETTISIEPSGNGEQIRLNSLKADAVILNGMTFIMGAMATIMGAVVAASGKPDKALTVIGMFGGIGLTMFAINLWRLPLWSRRRQQQMKEVADHSIGLLSAPTNPNDDSAV